HNKVENNCGIIRPEGGAGSEELEGLGLAVDLSPGEAHGEIEQGIKMIRLQAECRLVGADGLVEVAPPARRVPGQKVVPGRSCGSGLELLVVLGGRYGVSLSSPAFGPHEIEGPRRLMEGLRTSQQVQAPLHRLRIIA